LKYFFSILLFCCASPLWAQEQPTAVPADTVAREKMQSDFVPSGIRLGPAVNALIQTALDRQGTYYGFQADLAIRRFMIALEYGHADLQRNSELDVPETDVFSYSSSGDYYKMGVDANVLLDKQANSYDARDNVIFFGLRYALAIVDDEVSFRTRDNVWENSSIIQSNENLGVRWLEFNAGMKVSVFENVFIGYNLRYRFLKRYLDRGSLVPYRVPGFGDGDDESNFGFDYYIYYRIPFKK
jgi:hypothetical protein